MFTILDHTSHFIKSSATLPHQKYSLVPDMTGKMCTHLMSTTQLSMLNSTTMSPPSAQAAMGARQMLLLMKLRAVAWASFQVVMCRLPEACVGQQRQRPGIPVRTETSV